MNNYRYEFSKSAILRGILKPRNALILSVAVVIIVLIFWRIYNFEWSTVSAIILDTNYTLLLVSMALYYASFLVRGLRWRTIALESNINAKNSIPQVPRMSLIILYSWFLNAVGFLRIGDAYRGWILSRAARAVPSASLATVASERAQDIIIVLALVILSTAWIGLSDAAVNLPTPALYSVSVLFGVLLIGIIGMLLIQEKQTAFLPDRIRQFYIKFRTSTLLGLTNKRIVLQILLGVVGWSLEVLRFHFVAQAVGIDLPIQVSMIAALTVAMLTTIPTPGGFGFVEPGLTGLLIFMGFPNQDAISLTLMDRLISWVSVIVIGGMAFFVFEILQKSPLIPVPARSEVKHNNSKKL